LHVYLFIYLALVSADDIQKQKCLPVGVNAWYYEEKARTLRNITFSLISMASLCIWRKLLNITKGIDL
jgi:hypothetical protein